MTKWKAAREVLVMCVTLLAIYHAGRSISESVERHLFLNQEAASLRSSQLQAQQVNKELREGLTNYRSSSGIEKLARERLNLAGPEEIVVRIGK